MTESYPFPWKFEGYKYSDFYLLRQVTEAQVQADILALLHAYDVDAVPIDAGGRRQRGRMMGAAKKAGIDLAGISNVKTWYSIPAGFADLEGTLAPEGRSLYVEVKAPAWIDRSKKVIRLPAASMAMSSHQPKPSDVSSRRLDFEWWTRRSSVPGSG